MSLLNKTRLPTTGASTEATPELPSGRGTLKLQALEKRFGALTAVEDLNLDLAAGEFVTLLGPSGSGKTTTLNLVAGFETPDFGEILLDGRDITRLPPHKRGIGVVFQNYALFPHMTVGGNVGYPLRMRGIARRQLQRRVREALSLVQLSGYESRYPRELSGGQQQRVAVARSIVFNPPLLLMDEPLSALDKNLREDLQSEVRRLHRDLGTSILYVTHDQHEALALSDRILLMDSGRVVQVGTAQEVYQRPKTVFAASFIGQSNFLRGTVANCESGDVVVVRLRNGKTARGTATTPLKLGADVVVVIRPEDMNIAPQKEDSAHIGVKIDEAMYLGQCLRCRGRFETGETCTIEIPPAEGEKLVRRASGTVWWSTDKTVVIPSEQ